MISDLLYCRKAPLRWWRTRGFGIHSPFAFGFVNEIARERYAYYAYPAIDSICKRIGKELRNNRRGEMSCHCLSARGARCLFRIAARLGVGQVLSVGHTNGRGEMALRLVRRDMSVIVTGVNSGSVVDSVAGWSGGGIAVVGKLYDAVDRLASAIDCRPMLVVNNIDQTVEVCQVVDMAREVLERQGVVVVRNVNRDPGCREVEEKIGASMKESGAQFSSGRSTVFVGFRYLQPQRFTINLPF